MNEGILVLLVNLLCCLVCIKLDQLISFNYSKNMTLGALISNEFPEKTPLQTVKILFTTSYYFVEVEPDYANQNGFMTSISVSKRDKIKKIFFNQKVSNDGKTFEWSIQN